MAHSHDAEDRPRGAAAAFGSGVLAAGAVWAANVGRAAAADRRNAASAPASRVGGGADFPGDAGWNRAGCAVAGNGSPMASGGDGGADAGVIVPTRAGK